MTLYSVNLSYYWEVIFACILQLSLVFVSANNFYELLFASPPLSPDSDTFTHIQGRLFSSEWKGENKILKFCLTFLLLRSPFYSIIALHNSAWTTHLEVGVSLQVYSTHPSLYNSLSSILSKELSVHRIHRRYPTVYRISRRYTHLRTTTTYSPIMVQFFTTHRFDSALTG